MGGGVSTSSNDKNAGDFYINEDDEECFVLPKEDTKVQEDIKILNSYHAKLNQREELTQEDKTKFNKAIGDVQYFFMDLIEGSYEPKLEDKDNLNKVRGVLQKKEQIYINVYEETFKNMIRKKSNKAGI